MPVDVPSGFWDFTTHILTPRVLSLLEKPWERTALEIGHGDGRLMNAACHHFRFVAGIDIHDRNAEVDAFLRAQGHENFRLNRTDGRDLGMMPESVDFVYSWDTMRHVATGEAFALLLRESYQVLRAEGVAQIHIGRLESVREAGRRNDYIEVANAEPGEPRLMIRLRSAAKMAKSTGFDVIETGISGRLDRRGRTPREGEQSYLTLFKRSAGCLLA